MVEQRVEVSFICDRCKADLSDDEMQRQEAWSFRDTGGFASVFGDGAEIEIDLCQGCVKEVLGPWLQIS